jgi:hypothetical protein
LLEARRPSPGAGAYPRPRPRRKRPWTWARTGSWAQGVGHPPAPTPGKLQERFARDSAMAMLRAVSPSRHEEGFHEDRCEEPPSP